MTEDRRKSDEMTKVLLGEVRRQEAGIRDLTQDIKKLTEVSAEVKTDVGNLKGWAFNGVNTKLDGMRTSVASLTTSVS